MEEKKTAGKAGEMEKYREQIIEAVSTLVAIPSVCEEGGEPPFGKEIDRCLDAALEMMKKLGFRTFKAEDGKYGYAEIGEGPLFGVLGHLDVVAAKKADGWEHDPFTPMIKDGYLCGRGTQDDKGPMVAAAYALVSLLEQGEEGKEKGKEQREEGKEKGTEQGEEGKEKGKELKKRVRFIFGTDEESLWRCMAAYREREEAPEEGFTPDSTFPLTYAEKGLLQVMLYSDEAFPLEITGGDSMNAVAGHASCPYEEGIEKALKNLGYGYHREGDSLVVEGLTAHAKNPWKGISANLRLLRALKEAGYQGEALDFSLDVLEDKPRFEGFSQEDFSDFSGPVTVNFGKMKGGKEGFTLGLDLRHPVGMEKEKLMKLIREKAEVYHLRLKEFDYLRPIHVPLDSEMVQKLLTAYRQVTGDEETAPYISAGATYARAFDHCVAFGANLPSLPTSEHQPNERVKIDALLLASEVYREAFRLLVMK